MAEAEVAEAVPSERLDLIDQHGNASETLSVLPGETGLGDVAERNERFEAYFESKRAVEGLDASRDKPAAFRDWIENVWNTDKEE